jgi:hypothetical protein
MIYRRVKNPFILLFSCTENLMVPTNSTPKPADSGLALGYANGGHGQCFWKRFLVMHETCHIENPGYPNAMASGAQNELGALRAPWQLALLGEPAMHS